MQNVKMWMTRPALTIEADASALEALELMQEGGFRHLPVVADSGDLLGVLSLDDLRAALPFDVTLRTRPGTRDRNTAREYAVGELMTYAPSVTDPEAPLASAARELVDRRIGCLPVLDRGGKLVGILTETDALRALASLLDQDTRPSHRLEGLEELARELRSERTRILTQLGRRQSTERALSAESTEPMDEADLGTQQTEIELTGKLADLAANRLAEIDRALARHGRGELGHCSRCGRKISLGRLRALPGADRCMRCATAAAEAD